MAAIDLELLYKNNEENRWTGGDFDPDELKAISSIEQSKHEHEKVLSTKESNVVKPREIFPLLTLRILIILKTR